MAELPKEIQLLLDELAAGSHPIDLLLQALPEDEARVLRLCAIPHTFSAVLLPVLDPTLSESEAVRRCEDFAQMAMVLRVGDRLALHDEARVHLFQRWLECDRDTFATTSHRLAEHFDKRSRELTNDIALWSEALTRKAFHLIGADQEAGLAVFGEVCRTFRYRRRLADYERLLVLVQDYQPILSSHSLVEIAYHRAKLAADLRYWEVAREDFAKVIASDAARLPLRIKARVRLGMVEAARRDWNAAIGHYEVALRMAESDRRDLEVEEIVARTHLDLGVAHRERAELAQAAEYIDAGLALADKLRRKHILATGYNSRGLLHAQQKEYSKALKDYQSSLELLKEVGERLRAGDVYNNIGILHLELSQPLESRAYFEKSLAIKAEAEDAAGEGKVLNNLARVERQLGQHARAVTLLNRAKALFVSVHDFHNAGLATRNLARCYRALDDLPTAREFLIEARGQFEKAGSQQKMLDIDQEIRGLKKSRGCLITAICLIAALAALIALAVLFALLD